MPAIVHRPLVRPLLAAAAAAMLVAPARDLFAQAPVTVDYTYDANGQLVRAVDSTGTVVTYEYDFGGNLTGIIRSGIGDLGPPAITSAPATANADDRAELRIDGSNLLLAEIAISNPDIVIDRYRANDTHILLSLEIPPGAMLGPAQLTFTTSRGVVDYGLTVLGPRPAIFSVLPRSGGATGGTRVRLTGKNLTADTRISFGSQEIPSALEGSSSMVLDTPPGEPGQSVDITATNPNGTFILARAFTYSFPFAVPGALGVTSSAPAGSLAVRLRDPAVRQTTLNIASRDPSIVAIQESVVFEPGEVEKQVPVQGIVNGITRIDTSLGSALLSTAVFVTDPYAGPIEVYSAPVGQFALEGAVGNAVGVVCLPRRLPNAILNAGQSRSFDYPLPSPAGPGGLTLTLDSANPQVVMVPSEINVAEGATSVQFTLDAGSAGVARVAITGEGVDILIEVHVGVTPQSDGPFLAKPVGVYPIPVGETVAKPAGIYAIPVGESVAKPVGIHAIPVGETFAPPVGARVDPP